MNELDSWLNRVHQGDAADLLGKLPSDSIDQIVTDPPYGLQFMGKNWDRAVPSVEIWRQCLRVLKPGGFAFIMSAPRLDVLGEMSRRLAEAGFRTDFTPIFWTFASGFPKAQNASKAAMKKLGDKGQLIGTEVVDAGIQKASMHAGREIRLVRREVRAATDPAAMALEGAYTGYQPKPAVEVVMVAMKPLSERIFVDEALKNRKGVTWLDDARIPYQSQEDAGNAHNNALGPVERFKTSKKIYGGGKDSGGFEDTFSPKGRFPGNLLVSDDVLNDGKEWKAGGGYPADGGPKTVNDYGDYPRILQEPFAYGDSGSFSRYFSLDAWWDKRIQELPEEVQRTFPFLIVPKANKSERDKGLEALPRRNIAYSKYRKNVATTKSYVSVYPDGRPRPMNEPKNDHPTVKPVQLMCYLVTLGSRAKDVVLDPFMGSGTTGIACKILNRSYIGFEIDPEYVKIAEARINVERQVKLTTG